MVVAKWHMFTKTQQHIHTKCVNYIICGLYLNKAVFFKRLKCCKQTKAGMNTELSFEYKIQTCDPKNLMKKFFE